MGQGLTVVVLAAGEGKRFRSALPKPLHPVAGKPLLWHVLAAAAPLKADRTVVAVDGGDDLVGAAADDDHGADQIGIVLRLERRWNVVVLELSPILNRDEIGRAHV